MKSFWNERYSQAEYAYGTLPNAFLEAQLQHLKPGSILFPAEGEGRNAVYAATQGWQVHAFDMSEAGQAKAQQLAQQQGVSIDYIVHESTELPYAEASFDVLALIFAHFPPHIKATMHQSLAALVKPGGWLIFEAFSKTHLAYVTQNPAVGGPRDLDTLCSLEELVAQFPDFEFTLLEEAVVELSEGLYHNGQGAVVRALGQKRYS
jgi:SAM-dependent methyltransferase